MAIKYWLAGVSIGALALAALPAAAQTAPDPEASSLDEIVVTARQPNTPIEDSPASIEAFGSEELAKPGEFMASDLSRLSPGLTYKSTFGSSAPQFFIRGIGSNDVNPSANPGVAVYLNDVLLASPLGQNLATFDLSGAQILKGPQGTLFGRNATGGAIVFRTNRPGDTASATAAVGVKGHALHHRAILVHQGVGRAQVVGEQVAVLAGGRLLRT